MKIKFSETGRVNLLPFKDKVLRCVATLKQKGQDEFFGTTYLLTDIKCLEHDIEIDHCWVNDGVNIKKTNLDIGVKFEFDSKIHFYLKNGYGENQRADLTLSTPRNIKILEHGFKYI